ncbi:MAG: hypothetical protein C4325_10645 [Blastocatellia bacterium]
MQKMFKNPSRRSVSIIWTLLASVVIGVLIYLEQISLLYVLANLGLVLLLLIVAFSDLENVGVSENSKK